jgi:hypothetical protein
MLPFMPKAAALDTHFLNLDTHFLNVDLDIYSKRDLRPFVDSLGRKVIDLFVGRERGKFSAHLEVAKVPTTADSTIRAFCRLINDQPEPERKIWDEAIVRSFSIGVQAEIGSQVRDFQVKQSTVKAVSDVGAEIVLAVYAPAGKRRRK